MSSLFLSALDPTLIDGVRDRLAQDFAQRIFDAIPDISECIDFEAEACSNATERKRLERASQLLFSRGRDIQTQTAEIVRRIFDKKLFRLVDNAGSIGRQSLDGITLLADDKLDEEIAIGHCSRRLKEQCDYELWGLTQRLTGMTGVTHPGDCQNPVFPDTFAQALMDALGSLETNAGVRLVEFKTFGPVLLEIVPAVYEAANNALKNRGIEIESGEYYGRPVLAPERQAVTEAMRQDFAAKVNFELASALRQILTDAHRAAPTDIAKEVEAVSRKILAAGLQLPASQAGQASEPAWLGGLRDMEAVAKAQDPSQVTHARTLHGARQALQEKLTRDEQVVGDIVTVMFDRLMIDPRVPVQFRDIVARLQIPVFELALHDRSLLTEVDHPVRRLLDLIAEFGLILDLDDNDDSTVRSVENIIDGLVLTHREVPNAFQLAFDRLDTFFYHHEEASLQNDNNLRLLEKREANEFACRQADREIALRLQNRTLPETISKFILTAWRDVLAHEYLRGGAAGQPWKLCLATVDDLLKSLHPATDIAERRRLANYLPASIELLLNRPGTCDDQEIFAADFFVELGRAHDLAIAGKYADIGGELFVPSPEALAVPTSIASPSAALAALGLACGDWIETRDTAGTRRWRLNWITSIFGTCVFKHFESAAMCNMGCEELRERLAAGGIQHVRGIGLADEVLSGAFETVSRKARREETVQAAHSGSSAAGSKSAGGVNEFEAVPPSVPASTSGSISSILARQAGSR